MIAIGLDSGFASFGYAVLDLSERRWLVANVWKTMKCVGVPGYESNAFRTRVLWNQLAQLCDRYQPTFLAIEAVAFPRGKMLPTIISNLGRARALVDVAGHLYKASVLELPPQTIRAELGLRKDETGKKATQAKLEQKYSDLVGMWPRLADDVEHAVDAAAVAHVVAVRHGWL